MRRCLSLLALLALSGCATLPTGPSVRVLPGPGKSFEEFLNDDAICRQWASQQIGQSPQETANQATASAAVVGTAAGAVLGAVIGSASGHASEGAAIGAGSGLLMGAAHGSNAGQYYGYEAQRRYDIAYEQCMYAKGDQIPGAVIRTRRERRSVPPDYDPSSPPADTRFIPPDYDPSYPPPPPR
jgi:uncharacterized membrane protein YebE (DUF533 family)